MSEPSPFDDHRFCVAPMIDWTDRYCRYFHRQLTRHARLYTEMIVDEAILRGDTEYLLGHHSQEHPVALQLGGSQPERLAMAAKIGVDFGYDEINLNIGCPSDRVQSGRFGACLMREPALVGDCVRAMAEAVPGTSVTVKCRIGVDDQIPEEVLPAFVDEMQNAGVQTIIIHARMAWLAGLSPKDNRTIPPLDYGLVAKIAKENPDLSIILNGGLMDLDQARAQLPVMAGVMLGRAAYERPYILADVDQQFFGAPAKKISRLMVVERTAQHFDQTDTPLWRYGRHMLGLFHSQKGARMWRQVISQDARNPVLTGAWLVALAQEVSALSDEVEGVS